MKKLSSEIFKMFLSKKRIIKKLRNNKACNWYFYRWLATFFEYDELKKDVTISLAKYFYENPDKCNSLFCNFSDLIVIDNIIFIITRRPGIWIGKEGKQIEEIESYLNRDNTSEEFKYEICLIEDNNILAPTKVLGYYNFYCNNY